MTSFAIEFQNKAGERRTVIVKQAVAEAECARIRRFWATQQSMVERARDLVPLGFEHDVLAGFRQVTTN